MLAFPHPTILNNSITGKTFDNEGTYYSRMDKDGWRIDFKVTSNADHYVHANTLFDSNDVCVQPLDS